MFPQQSAGNKISIHALREEGDLLTPCARLILSLFLSTPSARRATAYYYSYNKLYNISIHALREEGDAFAMAFSIAPVYFYPRPPRGGRLVTLSSER